MKKIYIFSGLGVDERVFKNLHFENHAVTFIKWITPLNNESLSDYASRLIPQIKTANPILIGLSFGGMVVAEVAKQIGTEKIILIASAKGKEELPFYYRVAGKLALNKLILPSILKQSNFLSNWFFGIENDTDRKFLAEILHDTDSTFLKWAIDKIVNWQNSEQYKNLVHIHGTSDRILPARFVKADFFLDGGGHFMTVNKAPELNKLLNTLIA
jgi:pimeloyl-ACP methyl ester carboxylesterase